MKPLFVALFALLLCGGAVGTTRLPASSPPTIPLLFVPGYAASAPHAGTILEYVFNRGANPKTLDLSLSYASLARSLTNAGYVEGKTFFGAVYDWRMPLAPNDGVFDGKLDLVTAQEITSGDFSYAINYVGYWLDQVVQANPGIEYVDVVTHSTGGPLARAYIQSPAYGGAYVDKRGHIRHLPKIRYLILGACIHFGTVHSWRPWHADFQDVLAGFIPTTEIEGRFAAAAFAVVSLGGTILGPDYTITLAKILKKDLNGKFRPDPITFFRLYDPMRQSLMPTTDFLTPPGSNTRENVNNDPSVRSDVLLDLNTGSSPGNNPWAQTVGIPGIPGTPNIDGGVINTFSTGAREKKRLLDFVIPGLVDLNPFVCSPTGIVQLSDNQGVFLPLIDLLRPNPTPIPVTESVFARVGDTETTQPLAGDGNGFFDSYEGYTYGDPHIARVQWGNGPYPAITPDQGSCTAPVSLPIPPSLPWDRVTDYPVYHDVFFYNPDVRIFVVTTLTGQTPAPEQVITRRELNRLARFLNGRWLRSLSRKLKFLDNLAFPRRG
jgi:hypothetical protein